jgi:hypothetical protein
MEGSGLGPRASGLGPRASGLAPRCLIALGVCLLIPACSAGRGDDSSEDVELKVREALTERVRDDVAYDIGTRITNDRPIRHEFRLRNPTDTPIRLVNAMALKTCCSSIGPIPQVIPARGEAAVPVEWRAGHHSGRTRVQFVVVTDRADCRTIDLSLTANLLPAWEVSPSEATPGTLKGGAASSQYFQVITRRLGQEGLSPPSAVDSTEPFLVRFVGDATEEPGHGGIVESRRIVEGALALGQGVGTYVGELRLKWDDGTSKTSPIRREVPPHIRAMPSTIVVSPNDGSRKYKVIVNSDGRPFRILKVIGQALANPQAPGPDPAATHVLNVELDPSRLDQVETSEIDVTTDHPDQASLKIKVFLIASARRPAP